MLLSSVVAEIARIQIPPLESLEAKTKCNVHSGSSWSRVALCCMCSGDGAQEGRRIRHFHRVALIVATINHSHMGVYLGDSQVTFAVFRASPTIVSWFMGGRGDLSDEKNESGMSVRSCRALRIG